MPSSSDGFTLIELVVVLSIVALATTVGLLVLRDSRGTTRLQPFTAQIAADLKTARTRAILTGRPVEFSLDSKQRTYRVGTDRPIGLPGPIALSVRTGRGTGPLLFYPDGSSSGAVITISLGAASMQLDVSWLTSTIETRNGG